MKNKILKYISSLLIILIILPSVLFSFPKKTEATVPVADILNTVAQWITSAQSTISAWLAGNEWYQKVAEQLLKAIAKKVLQKMTQATVKWINSGFHGSPLFLENPQSFFKDIAKYEVKNMVDMFGYDLGRFPFGKDFALNTIRSYKSTLEINAASSLSNVMNQQEQLNYYSISGGGWNGFFLRTQYPQNNYLGFQMIASNELATKLQGTVQNAAQKVTETLQQGQGFLSPQTCPSNPDYNNGTNEFLKPSFDEAKYRQEHPYNPPICDMVTKDCEYQLRHYDNVWTAARDIAKGEWSLKNTCPDGLVNTTPGSVAANQIMTSLTSGQRQGELAQALGNSLSAIFDALLNKFIDTGLNSLASHPSPSSDTWSYNGYTLGGPGSSGTTGDSDWASGPDKIVILSEFKKTVKEAMDNLILEIKLIDNANPSGIKQMLYDASIKTRELDMCFPGPEINWERRLDLEKQKNIEKIQNESTDPTLANNISQALIELESAVSVYKNWVDNTISTTIPNAGDYLDAINNIKTITTEMFTLINSKSILANDLIRLNTIKSSLDKITTQPEKGSPEEEELINLYIEYDKINIEIKAMADFATIKNKHQEMVTKLKTLNDLIIKCNSWKESFGGIDRQIEINFFCGAPIIGGKSHGLFINKGSITHPEIELINTDIDLKKSTTPPEGSPPPVPGEKMVNINISCDVMYNTPASDYQPATSPVGGL